MAFKSTVKMEISRSHEHFDSGHIDLLMWPRGRAPGTAQQMEDGGSRDPAGPKKHRHRGHGGHGGGDTRDVGGLSATPGSGFLLAGTA